MRIVVGMSGGVDSAVAALLLSRQGHDVLGVFMNNWEEQDDAGVCTSERDFADMRRVCDVIGIPYYSVNFAKEYREQVFQHFLDEYRAGRTPNPDVLCNREIKFKVFLDFALTLGAEAVATGHFARVDCQNGRYRLLRAADENKDQTYFLYMLSKRPLSYARFPVGDLTKTEIREIARSARLPVSEKKDSTGVCFIGERDFKSFLMNYLPAQPGEIRTLSGKIMGAHDGLLYYTLGQRRGLGIGGNADGRRWFVVKKSLNDNILYVSQGDDSPLLYTKTAALSQLHFVNEPITQPTEILARFRHRQPLQRARITPLGDRILIECESPQRALTPGQSAVLYMDEICLGGGIIDSTEEVST